MVTETIIPEGHRKTDIGAIPDDWNVEKLEDIFLITAGRDLVKDKFSLIQDSEHPYPIYSNALTDNGIYGFSKDFQYGENCITVTARGSIGTANFRNVKFSAIGRLLILKPNKECDCFFISEFINQRVKFSVESTGVPQLTAPQISKYKIALPPSKAEQTAIATALSDADTLINKLEELICKKINIKQGAMQELLTGKKRLPGFSGEWETTDLGRVAEFMRGLGLSKADLIEDASYQCIHYGQLFTTYKELITEVKSKTNGNEGCFYSRKNDVLMPTSDVTPNGLATASCIKEDGVILGGGILIIRLHEGYDGLYLSYYVTQNKNSILKLVKGSTVFHLYANDLAKLEVCLPDFKEQVAIAQVLTDMDIEIEQLEQKLAKYRMVKQGMMQELLTGKTRLI